MEWISVKERLPIPGNDVIGQWDDGSIFRTMCSDDGIWSIDGIVSEPPENWAPIPRKKEPRHYKVPAYIARDKDGTLWLCYEKPSKASYDDIWEPSCDIATQIDRSFFPDVRWEDEEPLEIMVSIDTKA